MHKRTLLAALVIASPAMATKTQFFKHADRAAFESGKLENIVATNFGELRLSRALEPLMKDDGKYASIDAMADLADGSLLIGTTASGKLLHLVDGKTNELADFGEAAGIAAIAPNGGGDALIGVSGECAEVQILRKGAIKPERLAQLPEGVQYIWSIAVAADGKIYLGTGPGGQLFLLSADGKEQSVVYDSEEDNLRALAILNDTLFVGTDPHGLILKVDRTTGKAFVIYDAPETEVSSLLVDSRGGQIYAATSQLVEAAEETESASASGSPAGREEGDDMPFKPADAPATSPDEAGDGTLGAEPKLPAPLQDVADEGATTMPANPSTTPGAGPKPPTEFEETAGETASDGNAVYRIEPQGFVSEVFRDSVMIFGLARQEDQLYIATGPSGAVYQLDLTTEEHAVLAKVRPPQVTSIFSDADGRLLVGTGGGSAEAFSLSGKLAASGTFVSPVLDASHASRFGKLQVRGAVPKGATLFVSTRGSNVDDEDLSLWSDWSAPVPAARFTDVPTPTARYAQYKLTFNGDGATGPTVDAVEWAYVQPNVAPRIDSITVAAAEIAIDEKTGGTTPDAQRTIEWSTSEPNEDDLRYTVSVRRDARGLWTPIAKDLTESTFEWDTRRVSDGRYAVKVEASDALANAAGTARTASRVAEAVVVDNTPPVIGDVKVEQSRGQATITLRAADKGGLIANLEYAVDDAEHWQTVQPSDMLNDSPDEQYTIVLPLPGGSTRVVSLRCSDESGNTAHESVTVAIEK